MAHFHHLLAGDALVGVVGQGMGHLVPHHRGQLVIIAGHGQDPGIHRHLATR